MNTKERLKEFIEYKNISVRQFEISIGVSNSYVSNIFNTIGHTVRTKIKENYPDLNMDWILTGRGEMIVVKPEPEFELKEKPSYTSADGYEIKYVTLLEKSHASLERTVAFLEAKIAELLRDKNS